jgi:hypothetical protein
MTLNDQDFRRDKRVAFTTRAALDPVSGASGPIKDASTIDLSESGARVRLSGRIEPGQIVELYLSKRPEPCRVVWTAPYEATQELVAGLEFICPLPDPRRRQTPPSSKFEPIN